MFYGSPVFPADPGPGVNSVSAEPYMYSGAGFSIDWAPLDFGLHKARIQYAKSQYQQTQANFDVTKLDVQIATAGAFLDVVQNDAASVGYGIQRRIFSAVLHSGSCSSCRFSQARCR